MYPLVRGRWSFPGTVTCIITWVAQGILSVIINYDLIWPWCPKRAVERFIQWFVQHCVAHDRRVKSPRACIRLKVSPGACVRLVVLWIVGFTIVFTRWRNLLKLYTKKSWVWPMQDKLSAEGSFVYSWVLFIHTCNLTITGKLRHVVTFIHPLVTDASCNLGKQFCQGQNLGSEWSVVTVLIFAPVTNLSLSPPIGKWFSQQQTSSSRAHKKTPRQELGTGQVDQQRGWLCLPGLII